MGDPGKKGAKVGYKVLFQELGYQNLITHITRTKHFRFLCFMKDKLSSILGSYQPSQQNVCCTALKYDENEVRWYEMLEVFLCGTKNCLIKP